MRNLWFLIAGILIFLHTELSAQKVLFAERDSMTTKVHLIIEKPDIEFFMVYYDNISGGDFAEMGIFFEGCPKSDSIIIWDTTFLLDTYGAWLCHFPLLIWTVRMADANCNFEGATTDSIWIQAEQLQYPESNGITTLHLAKYLQIFPNPTSEKLHINVENNLQIQSIKIVDIYGRELLQISDYQQDISISHLANGLYIVLIETNKGIIPKKIVINK